MNDHKNWIREGEGKKEQFKTWENSILGHSQSWEGFDAIFQSNSLLKQQVWPDRAFIINVTEILDQMLEISENVGMAEEINLIFYRPPTRTSVEKSRK